MGWRIHYDDGSTFTDKDGLPEDAPLDGVQAIEDIYPDGTRRIIQGNDYYWWLGENWAGGSAKDLDRHLRRYKTIKFGRWINDSEYKSLTDTVRHLAS